MTGDARNAFRYVRSIVMGVILLLFPLLASAQQPARLRLDDNAIAAALAFYNRPGTTRMMGESTIAEGTEIPGNLAVLDGVLEIHGRVRGDLLAINGDIVAGPTARVDGSITIIGGALTGAGSDSLRSRLTLYRGGFAYALNEGELIQVRPRAIGELATGREFDFGRTDIIVAARPGYNRVEGLPIRVGPRITLGHSNPTILEGLITYRTASGLEIGTGDLGYSARVEQFLGGLREWRVGVRAYSEVADIESAGVTDRENSLAALVLHQDFRDHYKRRGVSGYIRYAPPAQPWSASVLYADEQQGAVRARHPWSLIDNDEPWRAEPLAARGNLRAISLQLGYDTRNNVDEPSHGWWITTDIEQALGGSLSTTDIGPAPTKFLDGTLDLRRYARLSPGSQLALRVMAGGSINGGALPPQRQRTLGGEGTLPGFALNQFDCGASALPIVEGDRTFKGFYGCDRSLLFQFEYQSDISFLRRLRGSSIDQLGLLQRVRLAAFIDAGRAYTRIEERGTRGIGNDDFSVDGGAGIRLGPVGLYWAVPLSGRGENVNFFVRVGPRF